MRPFLLGLLGLLGLLAACGPPRGVPDAADREGLVEALALLPGDPEGAVSRCRALGPAVRGECVVAAVEAAPDHPDALRWCDGVAVRLHRDECHFQRAERLGSLGDCARAGAFADSCRLHVWGAALRELWPDGTPPEVGVARARARMEQLGVDPRDLRFWSATFRHALVRTRPLDRGLCDRIEEPALAEACRRTGLSVYDDRINHTRDFGRVDCAGGVPEPLRHTPDPELASLRAARWAEICPGTSSP